MGAFTSKCKVCGVRMPHRHGRKGPWTGSFTCYDCSSRVAAEQRSADRAASEARTLRQLDVLANSDQTREGSVGADHERTFVAPGDDVWDIVLRYASTHELRDANLSAGTIVFTTKMSMTSPGEKYTVSVAGQDGQITIAIRGDKKRSSYALQPARIRKIADELFAQVDPIAESPPDDLPPWRR